MAKEKMKVFTLRVPEKLSDQIDERARMFRRTRNSEINVMLEKMIDSSVESDLKLLKT